MAFQKKWRLLFYFHFGTLKKASNWRRGSNLPTSWRRRFTSSRGIASRPSRSGRRRRSFENVRQTLIFAPEMKANLEEIVKDAQTVGEAIERMLEEKNSMPPTATKPSKNWKK